MIVTTHNDDMTSNDSPPSYDFATVGKPDYSTLDTTKAKASDVKLPSPQQPLLHPDAAAGPSSTTQPSYTAAPVVYHYTNPATSEHVVSLLPPDHPEMICLQSGEHVQQTRYALLGILAAIFWFPLGVGLCLLDRKVTCSRCGQVIDDGFCG